MGFLEHNANFGLLVLLVIVTIGLVGATLFYSERFVQINTDYKVKVAELNKTANALQLAKSSLTEVQEKVELKEEREESLSEKLGDVKEDRDSLLLAKQELENKNQDLEQELHDTKQKVVQLEDDLDAAESKIQSLKKKVDELEAQKGGTA